MLTLDRGSDFRCGSRWQARGAQMSLEHEQYSPDSIGDLYGRVSELLGFEANVDEHKVQWLSVGGDERFKDLFLEILNVTEAGPRLDRSFLSTERVTHGGFGARFFERLGLADGAAIPEALRAHVAAGLQHAVEDAVIRMAGQGRESLPRRRTGTKRAARLRAGKSLRLQERVRAARGGQCGHGDRRRARSLARRLPS